MLRKILLIDDDTGLLTLLKLCLERDGFEVSTAEDGKEGLREAYRTHPDVIVLEVSLCEMDGWITCQRLRQVCDVPIIILTAEGSQEGRIKGLSLGADDYLTKPCSLKKLKTRIHKALRRRGRDAEDEPGAVYDDGNLRVDLKEGTVMRRGKEVSLTPTELRLLSHLVQERGRIVPRKELLARVWGPECAQKLGCLSVYIRYLRQKIEDDPAHPHYIQTRWKLGHSFQGSSAQRL